jgi:phosphoribosylamine--glycine ligase
MNILLLGSGGREDALAWRLRQSPSCDVLIARRAILALHVGQTASRLILATRCSGLLAKDRAIDLIVIGPGRPRRGVADATSRRIATFGPSEAAAQLEGSRASGIVRSSRHSDRRLCSDRNCN